jgi:hypothetical protein
MHAPELKPPTAPTDPDTEKTLARILAAVEKKPHRKGWMELVGALVLSLTTMCSAWCAYQSKLWGGVQGARGGEATAAARKAAESRLTAGETRIVETAMFLKIAEAKREGKEQLATFLSSRLQPHTQQALAAWWKTKPEDNPDAPRSPFLMPEYKPPQLEEVRQLEQTAQEASEAAGRAGHNSDTYVLLTVLFASVLFFGGISGTVESVGLRRTLSSIALVLFLATFTVLSTMPVAWR